MRIACAVGIAVAARRIRASLNQGGSTVSP